MSHEHTAIIPDTATAKYTEGGMVTITLEDMSVEKPKSASVMIFPRQVPDMVETLVETLSPAERVTLINALIQGLL